MANNYTQTSFVVDCGSKEARDDVLLFADAIKEPEENTHPDVNPEDWDNEYVCGYIESDSETSLWFHGDESFDMAYFDCVIMYAMKKYKLPPVSYTWADTCDKMRTDEFSGGACVFVYNPVTDEVDTDSVGGFSWARERIKQMTGNND